jgi:hypothetical protein
MAELLEARPGRHPLVLPQAPAAAPPIRQFRRLTPAEQLERRRQGLCYNCDEPFVRGHQCKRLFYLESSNYMDDEDGSGDAGVAVGEEETVPVDANALVVSLHAVAGILTENTMVVSTTIQGQRLLALLDTGSTHNFIQGAALQKLGPQRLPATSSASRWQTAIAYAAWGSRATSR